MSNALERSLDEIIGDDNDRRRNRDGGERERSRERPRGPRSDNYRDRSERPRSGNHRDRYEPPKKTKLQRLSNGNAYIKISNLHPDITNDDLTQLFESVGKTSFTLIENDHSHKSSRLAYLGYEDVELNKVAVEKFDGRKAVGQIITVEEIRPLNILSVSSSSSDRRNNKSRRGPGGARSRTRTHKRRPTTAEDLDKELESYMKNDQPSSTNNNEQQKTVEDLDKELDSYMDRPFPIAN